jgi:hypothetical protein
MLAHRDGIQNAIYPNALDHVIIEVVLIDGVVDRVINDLVQPQFLVNRLHVCRSMKKPPRQRSYSLSGGSNPGRGKVELSGR